MLTSIFWISMAERAMKSVAQSLLAVWAVGSGFNLFHVSWTDAIGIAIGTGVLSILTTLAGIQVPTGNIPTGNVSPNALVPFAVLPRAQAPVPDLGSSLTQPFARLREETLDTPT